MMSTAKHERLTPAQRRILRRLREGARMYHGQASRSTNDVILASEPTIHALRDKQLIEWDTVNHTFALTKRGKALEL